MPAIKIVFLCFAVPVVVVLMPLWFLYLVGWVYSQLKGFESDPHY